MSVGKYRDVDPTLPWMGGSGLGPRRLSRDAADAVMRADDPLALALMLGYARSYAGTLGGAVISAAATAALALRGRRREASSAAIAAGACLLTVVETRRRARQWEAVIETRLAVLAGRQEAS